MAKNHGRKIKIWEVMPVGFPFSQFVAAQYGSKARNLARVSAYSAGYDLSFADLPLRRRKDLDDLIESLAITQSRCLTNVEVPIERAKKLVVTRDGE